MPLLLAWAMQPTTVAGLSALFGTLMAIVMHQLGWAQAVPLMVGAVTSIALPDNTAAKAGAEALAQQILSATAAQAAAGPAALPAPAAHKGATP